MPKVDDHADRIARMRRLCSAVDDVHEQYQRVFRDLTAHAQEQNDAPKNHTPAREPSPRKR
jgi:hypothetical protein